MTPGLVGSGSATSVSGSMKLGVGSMNSAAGSIRVGVHLGTSTPTPLLGSGSPRAGYPGPPQACPVFVSRYEPQFDRAKQIQLIQTQDKSIKAQQNALVLSKSLKQRQMHAQAPGSGNGFLGMKPTSEAKPSQEREKLVNDAREAQEALFQIQHSVEEAKLKVQQAQLDVLKYDVGLRNGDGKAFDQDKTGEDFPRLFLAMGARPVVRKEAKGRKLDENSSNGNAAKDVSESSVPTTKEYLEQMGATDMKVLAKAGAADLEEEDVNIFASGPPLPWVWPSVGVAPLATKSVGSVWV